MYLRKRRKKKKIQQSHAHKASWGNFKTFLAEVFSQSWSPTACNKLDNTYITGKKPKKKTQSHAHKASWANLKPFLADAFHSAPSLSDACSSSPCLNGGVCQFSGLNKYICLCRSRFKGQKCELDPDPCQDSPCHNQGMLTSSSFFGFVGGLVFFCFYCTVLLLIIIMDSSFGVHISLQKVSAPAHLLRVVLMSLDIGWHIIYCIMNCTSVNHRFSKSFPSVNQVLWKMSTNQMLILILDFRSVPSWHGSPQHLYLPLPWQPAGNALYLRV